MSGSSASALPPLLAKESYGKASSGRGHEPGSNSSAKELDRHRALSEAHRSGMIFIPMIESLGQAPKAAAASAIAENAWLDLDYEMAPTCILAEPTIEETASDIDKNS